MMSNKHRISSSTVSRIRDYLGNGGWKSVYLRCGVPEVCFLKPNHPCPLCGGKDRFSIFKDSGKAYCRHCGLRDCIGFVTDSQGLSFTDALRFIANVAGISVEEEEVRRVKPSDAAFPKENPIQSLWERSQEVAEESNGAIYLRSRGIRGHIPKSIRYCPNMLYAELDADNERWNTSYLPGLVCKISSADEEMVNLLRIYLDGSRKAGVSQPKKLLGKTISGGFVRLGEIDPSKGCLGIAEGVETALSVAELYDMPVWSVVNALNFRTFVPPEEVRELVVFADADSSFVGQREAFAAASRIVTSHPRVKVSVRIPARMDTDWNDVLVAKRECETEDSD